MTANTKENTLRRIQGKDPIQRLRCRLGWHRWTAWEYHDYNPNNGSGGYATCYCADCGMPRQERPYTKRKNK